MKKKSLLIFQSGGYTYIKRDKFFEKIYLEFDWLKQH